MGMRSYRCWIFLPLCVSLSALALVPASRAQEDRWKELQVRAATLQAAGNYTEAISTAKEALNVAEATFGADDVHTAVSLNALGLLYEKQGKYADAEPLYKRALAIVEKAVGPDHPGVATILNNLAELYDDQGKYADAEPLYKRALAIDERALGPDNPNVARALNNLAALYDDQGKYADAEPLYKRALAIDEKALGPDDPLVATDLNNFANLYDHQGKYADAEPLYKRALAIREKALGPDHPDVATDLNNLATLYYDQGKYADAEPLFNRALAIDEKALGPDHPLVAGDVNNLAELYREQGKYADAEPLYKRALAIDEKALGPDHPLVATTLNNLAAIYGYQGKYADAEPLYKRALAIRENALGPDNPDVATSLNNLALLYDHQGKYADAEPLYQRALAIDEKLADNLEMATTLNNLALLYDHQGKYVDAEPLYKRALAIDEKLGPDYLGVAMTLNNLAELYREQGKYADAEPLFKQALAIYEKTLGPDHPLAATALSNLATFYYSQGKYAEAGPFFDQALQNLSKQFEHSFTYMSEKDRLQFLGTVENTFSGYFSFCLSYAKQDPSLAGKMYDLLLWEKGMVGVSAAAMRARIAASGDADAIKMFDDLAAKRNQSSRLATLRPAGWEQTKKTLDDEANDLEGELARRVSAVSEQESLANVTWRDVQNNLRPGEAAVELVRFGFYDGVHWTGKSDYVAVVVTPSTANGPILVPLGEAANLEGAPLQDYQSFIEARSAGYEQDVTAIPGQALYRALWKPLEPALEGAKTVYISPDGVLDQVSLGILPGDDGEPLLSKYDLRVVSSTRDLLRPVQVYTTNTAVLAGNPSYDLTNEQYQTALASLNAPAQARPAATTLVASLSPAENVHALRSENSPRGPLPPLPGTAVEIGDIAGLLEKQKWQVMVYEDNRALVEAVRGVLHPRVLYLATHGFFEPDQAIPHKDRSADSEPSPGLEDPMLRSGLYFAGADRAREGEPIPEGQGDGILTAYEASMLDLHGTEMVALSACETGLGKVEAGEGVFGLLRGFEEAGADSVVISMWKVPDAQTQQLMTAFYENWQSKGMNKHEALREAQLELRSKIKDHFGQDLPYYWGAFVLVGR
ncbi:MAG TPA: CHAT domain-containing tetratricopeptide repeat protein [Methylomirabilota bacterium]|nr:CHAT domain-containing tetratricopeptide repeat protein [Methylomirabilota bacterium]